MKSGFTTKVIKDFEPSKLEGLLARFAAENRVVNVGFPASAQHTSEDGQQFQTAQIAAVHEFGSPENGIPERSFMRSAIAENRQSYVALNRQNLLQILHGKMKFQQALGQLGAMAQGNVQQKIVTGPFQALKQSTIDRKGSSKPLVDSGQMRQSVTWVLAKEGEE
jgi:hypothetical protein